MDPVQCRQITNISYNEYGCLHAQQCNTGFMSGHTHEGEVLIGANSYFYMYVYHPKPLWIVHVHVRT